MGPLDDDEGFTSIYYNLFQRDRTSRGGGLMVYMKKNLIVSSIKSDPCFEIIEMKFLTSSTNKIAFFACYRPQLYSEGVLDCLEDKVMNRIGTVSDIIIAGDLNHDMSQFNTPLHEFCRSFGLNNTIIKPTRLNPTTFAMTLLDVILLLSLEFFVGSGVINFPVSDHSLCISIFNHFSRKYSPKALSSRFLSEKRLKEIRLLFKKHEWEQYYSIIDPDTRWDEIKSAFLIMLYRAAPVRSVIIKERKVSLINSQLVSLEKKRNIAYHRARKTG